MTHSKRDGPLPNPLPRGEGTVASNTLAWWSAATIFISALLLFQVQPIISKTILPWFGGSPAVWTTCVLFFQIVLLGGYAYADALVRWVPPQRQGAVHIAVLILALLTLPITPNAAWKPTDGDYPAARILLLLAAKVGAPFFLLSTTGPLVQVWFSRLYPGRSPYRLYALSNVGSLAALLTYPFLIEPALGVQAQGNLWSLGFVLFAALIGALAFVMWRLPAAGAEAGKAAAKHDPTTHEASRAPALGRQIRWLALAALASMALLAVTNHLSQDIAVVPFMWVIPLSLYLLSFIICFDHERWYLRQTLAVLTLLAILWITAMQSPDLADRLLEYPQRLVRGAATWSPPSTVQPWIEWPFSRPMNAIFDGAGWLTKRLPAGWQFDVAVVDFADEVFFASASFLLVLFLICMVCHGELVKSKPPPQYLTRFYLSLSAGGALGGLFVGLVCPLLFRTHFELAVAMIGGFVVAALALLSAGREGWLLRSRQVRGGLAFVLLCLAVVVARGNTADAELNRFLDGASPRWRQILAALQMQVEPNPELLAIERNFYGTVSVTKVEDAEDSTNDGRSMYHGRIWHGFQFVDPQRQLEPAAYYIEGTGAALATNYVPPYQRLAPTSADQPQEWRFTTDRPDGGWQQASFDDDAWQTGQGGFGDAAAFGEAVRTDWTTEGIYLRRTFEAEEQGGGWQLVLRRQADVDVYVNGQRVPVPENYTTDYVRIPLGIHITEAIVPGKNTLAIHARWYGGQGQLIDAGLERRPPLRVAILGLGTGAMAAHAKRGDLYRFYEIDSKVVDLAHEYFTYLDTSPAKPEVVLGDARISLERELSEQGSQQFDVIHLDAFSGDAVPAHLLTAEAFEVYEQHLRKDAGGTSTGVIVVHISNRYLDLQPVVAALVRKFGYGAVVVHKEQGWALSDTGSDWVLVTKNSEFLNQPRIKALGEPLAPEKELLWTDQRTALFPILY